MKIVKKHVMCISGTIALCAVAILSVESLHATPTCHGASTPAWCGDGAMAQYPQCQKRTGAGDSGKIGEVDNENGTNTDHGQCGLLTNRDGSTGDDCGHTIGKEQSECPTNEGGGGES